MWYTINVILMVCEVLLAIWGICLCIIKSKGALPKCLFAVSVFFLNFSLYCLPGFYEKYALNIKTDIWLYMLECVGVTIKQFVGEFKPDMIISYSGKFSYYTYIFSIGALLAVLTTFSAALLIIEHNLFNSIKIMKRLKSDICDVVVGNSDIALNYVKRNKKSVLLLDENSSKELILGLIKDGYPVLRRRISVKLFKSRYFNKKTKYNFIYLRESESLFEEVDTVLSYFDYFGNEKDFHFYFEADEKVIETAKATVDDRCSKGKNACSERIIFLSKNELIARNFVEQNPITKYMPPELFEEDASVKADTKLNVFMLGFTGLSREIYRQFVINNQLVALKNGEYRALPLNYYIYSSEVSEKDWCIGGLETALGELSANQDGYFPMPELPYNTECIHDDSFGVDNIKNICAKIKEDKSLSYVIIDTGDTYENIALANELSLWLDKCSNVHLFVYSKSEIVDSNHFATYYGNTDDILCHDVVINDSLVKLAKSINKYYLKNTLSHQGIEYTAEELEAQNEKDWVNLSYFNVYSNIYLANNLRLKLNLLGYDYKTDGKGENNEVLPDICRKLFYEEKDYSSYLLPGKRNALLAQEHLRWNAYHLLNGYLPMKKIRIEVSKDENGVKKSVKNNTLKKHACLTTFKGLNNLSEYLACKANEIIPDRYKAEDFEYYSNDGLLYLVSAEFFREEKYSLIKRQ